MKSFALTGGVGMGKSTAAQVLRSRGISVVDTDDLARVIVEPGQPALDEIQSAFGPGLLGSDGRLRREELARLVFNDEAARKKLEAITHPRIRALWRVQLDEWQKVGRPLAVVVVPLLFEIGAETEFDAVICVACTAATQQVRLLARGWSAEEIARRNSAQWPVEQKIARANHVIWTEGARDVLEEQLQKIIPAP